MRPIYSNELYHYGILGMKWGVRRYQNPDGTLTETGKKRYGTVENLQAKQTIKQEKKFEAAKKKAVASGSADEISKYASRMTNDELQNAITRVQKMQTLDDLRAKEAMAQGKKAVDSAIEFFDKGDKLVSSMSRLYNSGAKITNAFLGKDLPIIGEKKDGKKNYDMSWVDDLVRDGNMNKLEKKLKGMNDDEVLAVSKRLASLSVIDKNASGLASKLQSVVNEKKTIEVPKYSEPSQEVRPKEKKTIEVPKYSEPSQEVRPKEKKTIEVPKYSEPSQSVDAGWVREKAEKIPSSKSKEYKFEGQALWEILKEESGKSPVVSTSRTEREAASDDVMWGKDEAEYKRKRRGAMP